MLADLNQNAKAEPADTYDVIIIGAGISGMYQLHCLRKLGLRVRIFESGESLGGTWFWNRYPGARFDSESYSYGYSFSEEVLQEWDWTEHFSPQPETLKYLEFVADKFNLRRDMQFSSRVVAARFLEEETGWEVELEGGALARGRFLITAVGLLSAFTLPRIAGIETFQGQSFHTARWPRTPVSFVGKRVAVIGTGATGVQTIQEVAKTAQHLTVFQRTPNWCAPLHNSLIDDERQKEIKRTYPEIFARCRETAGAFIHKADPRGALDVSDAEREALYEKLYGEPGFGIWQANFSDLATNKLANDTLNDFLARKIRQRVKDPAVADKLIPKDHGFGTRRIPLETKYFEVYNQPNVLLVDVRQAPIECITPTGIKTSAAEYDFDIIIYATGFDAVTGPLDRIDIRGSGGVSLKEKWADGPKTFLGLQVSGFPNMFTLVGPHNAATRCNIPRCIEQNVEWVTELVRFMLSKNRSYVEPTSEAETAWTEHVNQVAEGMLLAQVSSWYTGVNTNVPGKDKRRILTYLGGVPRYRSRCEEVAKSGYEELTLS
jgi:cation diffusion facilitator CzcD-associated flavoprotein CzcO